MGEDMCVDEMKAAMEMAEIAPDQSKIIIPLARAFTSALEKHSRQTAQKMKEQAEFCMSKWKELQKSNEDLRSDLQQFKADSMADRQSLREYIERLDDTISKSLEKATKWKAFTDMLTACFGTIKDTVKTLLVIGFLFGVVQWKDIVELAKLAF